MRDFDQTEERLLRYLEARYTEGRAAIEYYELKTDTGLSDEQCERMFALFGELRVITLQPTRGTFHMIEPVVCNFVRELDAPEPPLIGFHTPTDNT